jgi:hypothetical protein
MNNFSIIKTAGIPKLNLVNNVIISYTVNGLLWSYQLPLDVLIYINGKKVIAKSQIVDGAEVFERVSRKAAIIDFDFNLRGIEINTTSQGTPVQEFTFPLNVDTSLPNSHDVKDFFDIVWVADQVLDVQNSLLNALNIQRIVVESFDFKPERGNVDLNVRLKAYEAYYDSSTQSSSLIQ